MKQLSAKQIIQKYSVVSGDGSIGLSDDLIERMFKGKLININDSVITNPKKRFGEENVKSVYVNNRVWYRYLGGRRPARDK